MQIGGEQQHQQNTHPERWRADASDRDHRNQTIDQLALVECRSDAERHADANRNDQGDRRQFERRRQPLGNHGDDRLLVAQRGAEIELRDVEQELAELHVKRLVEAPQRAEPLHILWAGVGGGQQRSSVTRRQMQQGKDAAGHQKQHGNGPGQPQKDGSQHSKPSSSLRCSMQLMSQRDMPAYARAIILAEFTVKSQFRPRSKRTDRRNDALSINVSRRILGHRVASAVNSIAGPTKAMEYLGHA